MSDRPKKATAEMKQRAAQSIVDELVKAGLLTAAETDGAADDIAKEGDWPSDGYELAKALDDHCHWSCNLEMADILDGYSWAVRSEIEMAQKAWFNAGHPEPPLPPGARVQFRYGREQATGTIEEIYERGTAQYTVKVDGDASADGPSRSRAIINWEDVTALGEPTPITQEQAREAL